MKKTETKRYNVYLEGELYDLIVQYQKHMLTKHNVALGVSKAIKALIRAGLNAKK